MPTHAHTSLLQELQFCLSTSLGLCILLSFFFFLIFFVYLWLCWVLVSVRGLSLVVASGGHSSSRCAGLSLSWPLLLRSTGSRHAGSVIVAHGPSCSATCGIFPDHWESALAGRFSTTASPGKPGLCILIRRPRHSPRGES